MRLCVWCLLGARLVAARASAAVGDESLEAPASGVAPSSELEPVPKESEPASAGSDAPAAEPAPSPRATADATGDGAPASVPEGSGAAPASEEEAPASSKSRVHDDSDPALVVFTMRPVTPELAETARALDRPLFERLDQSSEARAVRAESEELDAKTRERLAECLEKGCPAELPKDSAARFAVLPRLERFAGRFILTAACYDVRAPRKVELVRQEVEAEGELQKAVDGLAVAVARALDLRLQAAETDFHLNLKLGHTLPALKGFQFDTFTLKFEIEADYYLRPYLLAWIEIGLVVGKAEAASEEGNFSLVPVAAGLKYVFRDDKSLRPYVGFGLGLGIVASLVKPAERNLGLHFNSVIGAAWLPWERVGFNLEASVNLDELRVTEGSNLLFGFNSNFGILLLF